jgi:phosphatidylserine decarboxylase
VARRGVAMHIHKCSSTPLSYTRLPQRRCLSSNQNNSKSWWASWGIVPIPIGLGIACLAYLQVRKVWKREHPQKQAEDEDEVLSDWSVTTLKTLPTRAGSRLWGSINEVPLPHWARRPLFSVYAKFFDCNLDEAVASDLLAYNTLQELFGRTLKEGSRPVDRAAVLTSPADCKVLHYGHTTNHTVEQIKGIAYKIADFLGELPQPKPGNKIYHCVLYLAPGDYHHFHSPTEWRAANARHYAGHLFSVSPLAAKLIPSLFVLNERVVLSGDWKHGFFSMTAVGAYNVGSIAVDCIPDLQTNHPHHRHDTQTLTQSLSLPANTKFTHGDHVGAFRLGSTVVLVFEAPEDFQFTITHNQKLKYGQAIGALPIPVSNESTNTPAA